ncbi:MAG: tRNA 2-thiouridine(34) synthase MnmA, partial [Solobacterium sp.]|nr:tRNA 2-thiouridine(34) synthase MnmA [Solobacterium sp.]
TEVNLLDDFADEYACTAKFRYRQPDCPVTLRKNPDGSLTAVYQGYEGITPGQEAVFYKDDILIASGTIDTVYQQDQDLMAMIRNYVKED